MLPRIANCQLSIYDSGIHLYCSASPRMLQCYLFTAVAAGHEAAELAPGAGPEEHEADGAAAHGAPPALHRQLTSLQPRLGEAKLVTRQFY